MINTLDNIISFGDLPFTVNWIATLVHLSMKEKDLLIVYMLALFSNFQALQDWKLLLVLVVFLIVDVTLLSIFTLIPATRLSGHFQTVRSKYLNT